MLLAPIFKVVAAIFRAYRHATHQAPSPADAPDSPDGSPDGSPDSSSWPFGRGRRPRYGRRRKVFADDEGEYVRFEELNVDINEELERRRRFATVDYRTEEQVSDAEWTEIRNHDK